MMNEANLLVIGCGGHARFVLSVIVNSEFGARGIIDLGDEFDTSEVIMGVPVVGCLSSIDESCDKEERIAILGIGDNHLRAKTFARLCELGFKFPSLIHSSAIIDRTALVGAGNVIGPNVVIGAEVVIGDNNIINSGAVIEHQSTIGNHNHVSLSATICGNVSVRDRVFLGASSVVIEKLLVPDDTILGAGGVLVSSPKEADLTLVGCPAKEVR